MYYIETEEESPQEDAVFGLSPQQYQHRSCKIAMFGFGVMNRLTGNYSLAYRV